MIHFKSIITSKLINSLNREVQANMYKGTLNSIKPYILETKLLKRVNKIIEAGSTNNLMLSQTELKQAIKNRILDLTYEQLAELNALQDTEMYELLVTKMPKTYLNLY